MFIQCITNLDRLPAPNCLAVVAAQGQLGLSENILCLYLVLTELYNNWPLGALLLGRIRWSPPVVCTRPTINIPPKQNNCSYGRVLCFLYHLLVLVLSAVLREEHLYILSANTPLNTLQCL